MPPPRLRLRLRPSPSRIHPLELSPCHQRCYASIATAITPAPPIEQTIRATAPVVRYPMNKPPSHKPPEFRKSQLHRQYTSLLHASPLILLFQHNNLKAVEFMGIRRELAAASRKVDEERAAAGHGDAFADGIKFQVVQTGIFAAALRVVEFFHPEQQQKATTHHPSDPRSPTSAVIPDTLPTSDDMRYTHSLSRAAHEAAANRKLKHGLEPLLSGPIALVTFPHVSPAHLKAVLSILSPNPDFPAPKRRTAPGYHEPTVQTGLQKLILLGARVEGKAFDMDGTRWVGSIEGGVDGLRAQLVAILQGVGAGITSTLEAAGRSLYFTMEGRKGMLEDEQKGEGASKGSAQA